MDNRKAENIYTVLGLNKRERAILTVITDNRLNISQISRVAKLPRTSLLYMLNKLERRSLVRREKIGNNLVWYSNVPTAIGELANQKVTLYEGVPAIFQIFQKIAALPKNARLQGIQPDNSIRMAVKKNELEKLLWLNARIKKKALVVEGIVHEKSVDSLIKENNPKKTQELFRSFIGRLEDYVKIPDEFANVESEIYIFGGSVYIINWNKEIGIGIHDRDMVALLQAMFTCTKELGIRYSQNEKMKGRLTPPNKPQ